MARSLASGATRARRLLLIMDARLIRHFEKAGLPLELTSAHGERLAVLGVHHGVAIRWSAWKDDATLVDGQALSFHGDAWKMFRGFLLLLVLMGAYSAAGHLSPVAAVVAFLILCTVWPALWRAALQFRLGNTSWRGLRMRFEGDLKEAYLACLPTYLPAILLVASGLFMAPGEERQVL